MSIHRFQACLNMYCAGLITLSNSQPSLWHGTSPTTSQPAMTDWLQLSGLANSHGASVCAPNEVLHSRPAVWMTQSVVHASDRAETVFSLSPLIQQLRLHTETKGTVSLGHFFFLFLSSCLVRFGKSQVQCRCCRYLTEQSSNMTINANKQRLETWALHESILLPFALTSPGN